MLIDCGSYGMDGSGPKTLRTVVEDILTVSDRHVHLLIATHRHRDHVDGFGAHADLFNRLEVDEVWLPWTENPDDAAAISLRRQQDEVARTLRPVVDRSLWPMLANSTTNIRAMDVLVGGFAGSPQRRFLSEQADWVRCDVVPGARVLVAGPPDPATVLRQLEVGAGMASSTLDAAVGREPPFGAPWHLADRDAKRLFRAELAERDLVENDSDTTFEALCFSLDKTINNTSVMLVIQYGTTSLLLPGDAQGEAWTPFLRRPELAEALGSLGFYKVSHHGSFAGTPPRILQGVAPAHSMVSTQNGVWPSIPDRRVLRELRKHGPVARSDRASAKGFRLTPLYVEFEVPC